MFPMDPAHDGDPSDSGGGDESGDRRPSSHEVQVVGNVTNGFRSPLTSVPQLVARFESSRKSEPAVQVDGMVLGAAPEGLVGRGGQSSDFAPRVGPPWPTSAGGCVALGVQEAPVTEAIDKGCGRKQRRGSQVAAQVAPRQVQTSEAALAAEVRRSDTRVALGIIRTLAARSPQGTTTYSLLYRDVLAEGAEYILRDVCLKSSMDVLVRVGVIEYQAYGARCLLRIMEDRYEGAMEALQALAHSVLRPRAKG